MRRFWLLVVALLGIFTLYAGPASAGLNFTQFTVTDNPAGSSTAGQNVQLTANVTTNGGGFAGQTIRFYQCATNAGPTTLGNACTLLTPSTTLTMLSPTSYTASINTTALVVQAPSYIFAYDANTGNVSTGTSHTVNAATTSSAVTLTSSKNPANVNDNITFSAQVSTGDNAAPTGSVTFSDTFNGTTTILSTQPVSGAGGVANATFSTSTLASGSHSIVVGYSGDSVHAAGASAPLNEVVGQANAIVISFTSSANPAVVGQAVVLTATLSTNNANGGLSGTVTFTDGGATLGSATVTGNSASITTSTLTAGLHALEATYSGDTASTTATGDLSQTINRASSAVALTSSSNPSASGAATFTAAVTAVAPANGAATGSVTFSDGGTALGTVALDGTGKASFDVAHLSAGSHVITAAYNGDSRLMGSSTVLNESVTSSSSDVANISLTATPNPAKQGDPVTIAATITVPTGTPTGDVTVSVNGNVIGTAAINGTGNASYTTTELPVGTTTVTVAFDGMGFYPSGSGSIAIVVEANATGTGTGTGTTADGGAASSSSSSSSGSTPAADAGTTIAPVSTVTVGSGDSGCSSTPSSPASGVAAFALGMLGLALVRRRRAS